jgi:hypothetical protein
MQMLSRNPAAAYRRVALDARIEASGSGDLTRICLEEAMGELGRALISLERFEQDHREVCAMSCAGRVALARAQTILLWLAKSVAPEHPLSASLKAFYGGLAGQVGEQILQADARAIAGIRQDISDLLDAAG